MVYWQPQSTSYGGALETVHIPDHGIAYQAQLAENAAHLGEFNQPFRDYVSLGLYGSTDNPANVNAIQSRVAALEYSLANGGSLAGIAGADHSGYASSLAIAGRQFASPDYSAAPDLLYGDGFTPAPITYAELSPAASPSSDLYSPAWTNAYSDAPSHGLPAGLSASSSISQGRSFAASSPFISAGATNEYAHEISGPSYDIDHHHEISHSHTAGKTIFLGESTTAQMHLNLSPEVQERLAGISSTLQAHQVEGGSHISSHTEVSMPSVPDMAPTQSISHSRVM